jgi:nicotinamide riboside kinase
MKKIVVLGPESTGKSFLCEQLATHYQTKWVPEFARDYLEKNGPEYQYDDLYEIAKGQLELEERAMDNEQLATDNRQWTIDNQQLTIDNKQLAIDKECQDSSLHLSPSTFHLPPSTFHLPPLFLDTDLYTIKIWSEISFNKCDNRILSRIADHRYDLYLLCNTDLPWAPDPLREYPDLTMRRKIYHYYKDALVNQEKPWVDISGNYEERFLKAVEAVDSLIQ